MGGDKLSDFGGDVFGKNSFACGCELVIGCVVTLGEDAIAFGGLAITVATHSNQADVGDCAVSAVVWAAGDVNLQVWTG